MQNWSLLVDSYSGNLSVVSVIQDCGGLLFSHLALSASFNLAELNGKRQALCKRIPFHSEAFMCSLQGAVSLGTSSGSSAKCTSPGQKMRYILGQGDLPKGRKIGVHFGLSSNLEGRTKNSRGDVSCSL